MEVLYTKLKLLLVHDIQNLLEYAQHVLVSVWEILV